MKKKFSILLLMVLLSTFLGGCSSSNQPATGLPSDPAQMTNKQKEQFHAWEAEQAKIKNDNTVDPSVK
jgi:PBP1b-binding outer membrane lipoprotein LpoB